MGLYQVAAGNLRIRCFSSKPKDVRQTLKYTSTINLPKTNFPNRLARDKREQLENTIVKENIPAAYEYQKLNYKQPAFVLHDGPPYANGELHMGHAVNKILKDITLRYHVSEGRAVNYIPGWDCHGLPIELKALKESKKSQNKQQTTNAANVRQLSRKFAKNAIKSQKDEFQSWGIFGNWQGAGQNTYETYSGEFISNQLKVFMQLYEKGFIYRDLKPVYWSPSSGSALAEAELIYDDNHTSPSLYLRCLLSQLPAHIRQLEPKQQVFALIWTTTPWTLPSNQAICYNPALEYSLLRLARDDGNDNNLYIMASDLVGEFEETTKIHCSIVERFSGEALQACRYLHPLAGNYDRADLPFWPATHVKNTKGTGLVHTAPAHGPDDFLIGLANKAPIVSLVNALGQYTEKSPEFLRDKNVLREGNQLVLEHLAGHVVWSGSITHSHAVDWRTNQPVIIRASEQWFINTELLKAPALEALEGINVYPRINAHNSKQQLAAQLQKRPYWCISRQRAWGVPIPVLYDTNDSLPFINRTFIEHLSARTKEAGNIDFWWTDSLVDLVPDKVLDHLPSPLDKMSKGVDIFDIWFDSGCTWSHVLPAQQVADLYLEGYDQFTGWFQSSLLISLAARNIAPYKSIFVHGFTVDEKGHKMSKSVGNVISPKQIINKYGVDVLRWWVAGHATQHMSIIVSDKLLQQSADNVQKMRTTLRFLNGVLGDNNNDDNCERCNLSMHLNRYLLSSLYELNGEIKKLYANYEYNNVIAHIVNFVANQISAIYIHLIKDRLYCGTREQQQEIRYTVQQCYRLLCKILWPITPFVVEESWTHYVKGKKFHEHEIQVHEMWKDGNSESIINTALQVKRLVNQAISMNQNSWNLSVEICVPENSEELKCLQCLHPLLNASLNDSELCEILQVGAVSLRPKTDKERGQVIDIGVMPINNTNSSGLCPRCRRFTVDNINNTCSRCTQVLLSLQQ